MKTASRLGLTRQNALLLIGAFVVFERLVAAAYFLMLPLARRSARDAGAARPRETAGGAGCHRIGVLDRGPGIPPAEREAVFRPFYRLEASRSLGTGGSGLGLAIVRQLAVAHGWTIRLDDRPGGGLAAWLQIAILRAA